MTDELNLAIIRGTVTSEPRRRELPSTNVVWNFEVSANGACIPVVAYNDIPTVRPGDKVYVKGVVSRRFFRAGGVTQSRTEVVAERVKRLLNPPNVALTFDEVEAAGLDGTLRSTP